MEIAIIGEENRVNNKLVNEMVKIQEVRFFSVSEVLEGVLKDFRLKMILINLMDIGPNEGQLMDYLRSHHASVKRIAIHCFQSQNLIDDTLKRGYDSYWSLFDISEKFLQELGLE